eukprot:CAMPEP_0179950592 /NCGR_PEP_ID=MMETSP0983-20121128/23027_1 /TAXON_ID=483367 /ORGANISM="non described non described, Strain CCMP 2436" /LENGTH=96 /DNA_ID=CAMNT_0021860561 /DNA_START=164 /DNA_END=454 /DNA_ORIENTATION=-
MCSASRRLGGLKDGLALRLAARQHRRGQLLEVGLDRLSRRAKQLHNVRAHLGKVAREEGESSALRTRSADAPNAVYVALEVCGEVVVYHVRQLGHV